ncbi:MAG: hypothetical protein Q9162_004181 [Coniocarpon cinnabarinum]
MMHAHLSRTHTAPAGPQHSRLQTSTSSTSIHQASHHDSANSTNSRSSDSTQNTSSSTLFSIPPTSSSISSGSTIVVGGSINGSVLPTDNVINRTADKNESLFQICMTLRASLSGVPGFEEQCIEVEDHLGEDANDPVLVLWNVFRKGYPLMSIYNHLSPDEPITVDEDKIPERKRSQMAAYKFTQACIRNLNFAQQECYMTTDLKGSEREVNMSGFVKVVNQVRQVVVIMISRGILHAPGDLADSTPAPRTKMNYRDHVIDEMVRTERTYVQHLELLQAFERHVLQSGTVSGDVVHSIFLNLDDILEFQRRLLVRMEQTNSKPVDEQNWGALFFFFSRVTNDTEKPKDFRVYEPFIENQKNCEETTIREFDKLRAAGGSMELQQIVESPTHLTGFLLKPFQRLSKYPLLLRDLRDKGGLPPEDERNTALTRAIEAVNGVLQRTNAVLDRKQREEAVKDLKGQVEDWKHHRVEAFGELLLYGTHTVVKGDPTKDSEREVSSVLAELGFHDRELKTSQYRMYLFEKILLCCKEINPNKPKNKVKSPTPSLKNGKPRLQLKGRIFMQNVTETKYSNKPGQYSCKIFWRGDDSIESFLIRFTHEDVMKKWTSRIEAQRRVCCDQARLQQSASDTTFSFLQGQQLTNPYLEHEDEFDTGYDGSNSSTQWSRNASSSSLQSRHRSGTGGSTYGRGERPAMPANSIPKGGLTVSTQAPGMISPANSANKDASYFSPGGDSPNSSRASTASSMLGFPRQPVPPSWQTNDNRYTAPARDPQGNYYDAYGSKLSGRHAQELAMIRNRSMSTNSDMARRANPNAPPVPSVPQNLLNGGNQQVNRSQTNSPITPDTYSKPSGNYPRDFSDAEYHLHGTQGDPMTPDLTPLSLQSSGAVSPPIGSATSLQPSQLKVKVKVPNEGSTMMLVVSNNISFDSLKDRIEAKLQRISSLSLSAGTVKLKYLFDDDYVSIDNDEDVQVAFETWREKQQGTDVGGFGEVELFCHPPTR